MRHALAFIAALALVGSAFNAEALGHKGAHRHAGVHHKDGKHWPRRWL